MAVKNLKRGQVARPSPQTLTTHRMPAPIKGMDARVALTEGSLAHCVYTYNMVPYEYGMALRKGYREWVTGVDNGASSGIHTMIPFDGVEEDDLQNKLFAVNNEGIWDVTTSAAPAVLMLEFDDQQPAAGYGVYTHYTNDAERDVLLYADNFNGLFSYDAVLGIWEQAPDIQGPIVENIRFVVSHKQRLWMIEENSTVGWYLPVGSNSGQATEFFFGSKFKHGGNLEGLFNWSVDGGDGLDDYLVAVSRSGDVLPYRGADPSNAVTWEIVGTYFIGKIPKGPQFGSEHGGELFLLSEFGLVGMNTLLSGADSATMMMGAGQSNIGGAITGLMRGRMLDTINDYGWQVQTAPSEGSLLVAAPRIGTGPYIQYTYNIGTQGWGLWRGVPMTHFDSYDGAVVFGSFASNVYRMDTTVDNATIIPPEDGINGDPIEFSMLTSFQALGADAQYKSVKLIRADFITGSLPDYTTAARYDYDIKELVPPVGPPVSGSSVWDVGLWDVATWSGTGLDSFNGLQGNWGTGRYVAVAMAGTTREQCRIIGWDVLYTTGGALI